MTTIQRFSILAALVLSTAVCHAASDPQRVKQYAVMGYEGIQKDLAAGEGPYLKSLLELLQVKDDKKPDTLQQLRAFAKDYPNMMDFADQVASLAGPVAPAVTAAVAVPAPVVAAPVQAPLPARKNLYQGPELKNALNHLVKGMRITVYPQVGEPVTGIVSDYTNGWLWFHAPQRILFKAVDIRAVEYLDRP